MHLLINSQLILTNESRIAPPKPGGIPVLIDNTGHSFEPYEVVTWGGKTGLAGDFVFRYGLMQEGERREFCAAYLAQYPPGAQLDEG